MKKPHRTDIWKCLSICIVLIVILTLGGIGYQLYSSGYPGVFVYQETRYTDNATEVLILDAVEKFNYTCIPVNQSYIEWDVYLNQSRLNHLAQYARSYNPFLNTGRDIYHYIANVTPYNTLTVTLTTESYPYWITPFINITTGTE